MPNKQLVLYQRDVVRLHQPPLKESILIDGFFDYYKMDAGFPIKSGMTSGAKFVIR